MVLGKPCEGVVVHRLRTSGMECLRKEATRLSGTGSRGLRTEKFHLSFLFSAVHADSDRNKSPPGGQREHLSFQAPFPEFSN